VAIAGVYVSRLTPYPGGVPRSWVYSLAILLLALLASMIIAAIKLI
jgi:hypothetical protein